MAPYKLAATLT